MEAILSVPIGIVIEDLCLDPNIKAQLRCARTGNKTPLSPIYELMVARESGDWERVATLGKSLNLSLYFIAESYNEAMRWAHHITSAVNAPQPR
jgi:c-di-GMP-related signal transduction protein